MNVVNRWAIEYGRKSKEDLLFELRQAKVCMNAYATLLFMDDGFKTSSTLNTIQLVEMAVCDLGLKDGGLYEEVIGNAKKHNLEVCPLELASYLRLRYVDQPERYSLTVASTKLRSEEKYPNGFYLSMNAGFTWLRGYHSTADWVWSKDDRFVFIECEN